MQLHRGVDVDQVRRAKQACIVKIAALEEQGVEGCEGSAAAVATGNVGFEVQARCPLDSGERVAHVASDAPGEDVIAAEATELKNWFNVIVTLVHFAEESSPDRVSLFGRGARGIDGVFVAKAKV